MACHNWTHKASAWSVFYSRVKYVKGKGDGKFFPVNITKARKGCSGIAPVFPKLSHKTEVTVPSQSSGEGDPGTVGTKDSVGIWRIQDFLHLT
jgi:hypothetical protein